MGVYFQTWAVAPVLILLAMIFLVVSDLLMGAVVLSGVRVMTVEVRAVAIQVRVCVLPS